MGFGATNNKLSGMGDVYFSNPANGHTIVYDSSTLKWVNKTNASSQLADGSVVSSKIADGAVTTAKIASQAVDESQLSAAVVAKLNAAGEATTAANIGAAGIGVFKSKSGSELQFKKIAADNSAVTVSDDTANDEIKIGINAANLGITKSTVGLADVDNTSDANKPISTATQAALDGKIDETTLGQPNGPAKLDASGKLDASTLKDYAVRGEANMFTEDVTVKKDGIPLRIKDAADGDVLAIDTVNKTTTLQTLIANTVFLQEWSGIAWNTYWDGTKDVYAKDGPTYRIDSRPDKLAFRTATTGAAGAEASLTDNFMLVLPEGRSAFHPTQDSPIALLSLNAAGETVFRVNTTNSRVEIGDNSTPSNVVQLTVDSIDNPDDPSSTVNGSIYYNIQKKKFRAFEDGAWKDLVSGESVSLTNANLFVNDNSIRKTSSTAFQVQNDSSQPVLTVDTDKQEILTPKIKRIQEASINKFGSLYFNAEWDYTADALKYIEDGAAFDVWTNGPDLIVSSAIEGTANTAATEIDAIHLRGNGSVVLKALDNADAFVVLNNASEQVLRVNTAESAVIIGNPWSDQGLKQFLLDNQTSATDPVPIMNGAMYYNDSSDVRRFRVRENNEWRDMVGVPRRGGRQEDYTATTTSNATTSIDLGKGNIHQFTLAADTTFQIDNAASGASSFSIIVTQDGAGGHSVTWPASVKWPNGTPPTLSALSGQTDMFTFTTIGGGDTWLASIDGQAY